MFTGSIRACPFPTHQPCRIIPEFSFVCWLGLVYTLSEVIAKAAFPVDQSGGVATSHESKISTADVSDGEHEARRRWRSGKGKTNRLFRNFSFQGR